MSIPPVIEWRDGAVHILDQRRLPDAVEVLHCTDVVDVCDAIRGLAIWRRPTWLALERLSTKNTGWREIYVVP